MTTQGIVFLVIVVIFIFSRITEALEEAKRRAAERQMMNETDSEGKTDWEELRRRAQAERTAAESAHGQRPATPASTLPSFDPAQGSNTASEYRSARIDEGDGDSGDAFGQRRMAEDRRRNSPVFTMLGENRDPFEDSDDPDAADRQAVLMRKLAQAREKAEHARNAAQMAQRKAVARLAAANAPVVDRFTAADAAERGLSAAGPRLGAGPRVGAGPANRDLRASLAVVRLGRLPAIDARAAVAAAEIMTPRWQEY